MVKSTYGTGAFALLHTGATPAVSRHRLLTTLAYRLGGETAYALEGSIFIAGAAVQWLRDRLRAVNAARRDRSPRRGAPTRGSGVYFVPAFAGLGAPYWAAGARGALTGLTAECGLPEIARATLESVGYQTRDLVEAMAADCGLRDRQAARRWRHGGERLDDAVPRRHPAGDRSNGRTRWRRPPGARPMSPGCRADCVRRRGEMMARWSAERRFAPAMAAAEREERYAGWRRAVAGVLAAASR